MSAPIGWPNVFEADKPYVKQEAAQPVAPWVITPIKSNDEELKQRFGIELAKPNTNAFQAACVVFPTDNNKALWVSRNWLADPIVVAARDEFLKTSEQKQPILDKEQLAARVLAFAEEKNQDQTRYLVEAKERLAALALYAKIAGYTDNIQIDASTKTFTHNEMRIKLVKPDVKETSKIVEHQSTEELKSVTALPLKLKLVS